LNQNPRTLEFNNATSDLVVQKQAEHIEKVNVLRCLDGTYNVESFPKLCTLLSSKIIVGKFSNKSTKFKPLRQQLLQLPEGLEFTATATSAATSAALSPLC
jgi:hypothetical protein